MLHIFLFFLFFFRFACRMDPKTFDTVCTPHMPDKTRKIVDCALASPASWTCLDMNHKYMESFRLGSNVV